MYIPPWANSFFALYWWRKKQLCSELKFKVNKNSFINHPTKPADGNISYQHIFYIFKPICNVAWCQVPFNIISLVKRQHGEKIKQHYSKTFKKREPDSGKMQHHYDLTQPDLRQDNRSKLYILLTTFPISTICVKLQVIYKYGVSTIQTKCLNHLIIENLPSLSSCITISWKLTSHSELLTFVVRAWCQGFLEWCLKTDRAGTASEICWWESERERNCIFYSSAKLSKILH